MDARAKIKPASDTESELQGFGTYEQLTSARARLKREIFQRLKDWLANGASDFERRRRRTLADAERKGGKV